jgi:type II secretory pathway pseudopilin PulG
MIELIVTTAVVGIVTVALYGFFITVREVNDNANNAVIANQLAEQQMEIYRNTTYNNLTTGTQSVSSILTPYPTLRSPRSATVTITELQTSGYKQVDVVISYTGRGGTKTVRLTTLVAVQGINK